MPIILTEHMVQDATEVAVRLHAALTEVLGLPPVRGRRAATMAAELGVGRMTCQRIARLGKSEDAMKGSGPRLLAELPGVNGLRQFLEAVIGAGISRDVLAEAFAAVDAFEDFLARINLSQTAFASALLLHDEASDPERLRERRLNLFDAASAVTGQSADVTISMMAVRPSTHEGFNFEQIAVRGYSQMRASGSTMPIRLPINMAYSSYRNVTSDEAARQPQELIEAFCTKPLPSIDTRVIKAEHLAQLINPEHIPTGEPFDCFAMQHNQWNITDPGPHKAIWLYIDYPTKHCIFDLFLHRSMAETNRLSGDCHLWGTSLLAPPDDLWTTRFADQVQFKELGAGTSGANSVKYGRQKELAEHMFREHGWDNADFVGVRCEMELPVWRSGICVVMERV